MPGRQRSLESAEALNFLNVTFSFLDSNDPFSHLLVIINWIIQVKCVRDDGVLRWSARRMFHPSHWSSTQALLYSQNGFLVSVIYMFLL